MRLVIVILSCGIFCLGCKHFRREAADSAGSEKKRITRSSARTPGATAAAPANRGPKVTPIDGTIGKVAAVNPNLRFVVVDYSLSKLPALEQRLGVYRQGQKVGEVKISGPERSSNIAADLVAGEAKVGDEVRRD